MDFLLDVFVFELTFHVITSCPAAAYDRRHRFHVMRGPEKNTSASCYHPRVSEKSGFKWTVALILFGVLFLGVSDTQLVAPLLPLIAQDLKTTAGRAGIIVTAYSLAAAGFALLVGPVSDRVGRKRVLVAGLTLFTVASFLTYHVSSFSALVILRAMTGLAAGTLSTCALSFAGDYYPYQQRGRAMGVLSMGYFVAFVVGVPAGALAASRLGWHWVFGFLSAAAAAMLVVTLVRLPLDTARKRRPPAAFADHFFKRERMAGVVAAFLTSGGIVGFLTYIGAWLKTSYGMQVERIGLVFMVSGLAAVAASPLAGWLADHAGKRNVIIWANVVLSVLFLIVAHSALGAGLIAGIAALSMAASARQAPLHALTTELVGPEVRGEYIAVRNAASQLGIAAMAAISASAFDAAGFVAVAWIAAIATLLIPVCCIWLREPKLDSEPD
jgi:predicted MFS family arabinose efflux permease